MVKTVKLNPGESVKIIAYRFVTLDGKFHPKEEHVIEADDRGELIIDGS